MKIKLIIRIVNILVIVLVIGYAGYLGYKKVEENLMEKGAVIVVNRIINTVIEKGFIKIDIVNNNDGTKGEIFLISGK